MKPQNSCAGAAWVFSCTANNSGPGWKVPAAASNPYEPTCEERRDSQGSLPKTGQAPILMIKQRNFDFATGFFLPLLSDRFPRAPIRSHIASLVSGAPETPED